MPDEVKNEKTLIRQAYTAATAKLRDEHRAHFNSLMQVEAKRLGVNWKPRPTSEERAREDLRQMLADSPDLREYVLELVSPKNDAPPPKE